MTSPSLHTPIISHLPFFVSLSQDKSFSSLILLQLSQDHTFRAHLRLQTPSSPALALQLSLSPALQARSSRRDVAGLLHRSFGSPEVPSISVDMAADPSAGRVWYSHRPCRAGRCFRRSTSRCLLRSEWHPARPATTGVSAVHHGGAA